MAEAVVNAAMRMDNKQFLDATKNSTYQVQQMKRESGELAKQIAGANAVSTGFANILSGNLSAGFASVSAGLNGLAPKVMALLGPIGLVVGAFTAAYQAGKKLDSVLGISSAVGKAFGGDTSATDDMAAQTKINQERRRGMQEGARIADESAQMAEKRLKGVAKLEADYARDRAEVEKRLADATNGDVQTALRSRLDMMATFHAQDVAAVKAAEAEKVRTVKEAEAAKARAAAEASANRTRQLQNENEAMVIGTLAGVNKIQAEFEKSVREIDEQANAPGTTPEQRDLLMERRRMVGEQRQKALDDLQASTDKQNAPATIASLVPARMDQMAAVGGYMGGERMRIPMQDKAERAQAENTSAIRDNARAVAELTAQVNQLQSAMTGGIQ